MTKLLLCSIKAESDSGLPWSHLVVALDGVKMTLVARARRVDPRRGRYTVAALMPNGEVFENSGGFLCDDATSVGNIVATARLLNGMMKALQGL